MNHPPPLPLPRPEKSRPAANTPASPAAARAVWNLPSKKLSAPFAAPKRRCQRNRRRCPAFSPPTSSHDLVAALRDMQGESRGWARATPHDQVPAIQAISVFDASKAGQVLRVLRRVGNRRLRRIRRRHSTRGDPADSGERTRRLAIASAAGTASSGGRRTRSKKGNDRHRQGRLPAVLAGRSMRWSMPAGRPRPGTTTPSPETITTTASRDASGAADAGSRLRQPQSLFFDDTLVCGSKGVHPGLLRNIVRSRPPKGHRRPRTVTPPMSAGRLSAIRST